MTKVVVCPEHYAAEAGMEVLKKGGNAIDGVVAGALAQGVTHPKLCGLGGAGLFRLAKDFFLVTKQLPAIETAFFTDSNSPFCQQILLQSFYKDPSI